MHKFHNATAIFEVLTSSIASGLRLRIANQAAPSIHASYASEGMSQDICRTINSNIWNSIQKVVWIYKGTISLNT